MDKVRELANEIIAEFGDALKARYNNIDLEHIKALIRVAIQKGMLYQLNKDLGIEK